MHAFLELAANLSVQLFLGSWYGKTVLPVSLQIHYQYIVVISIMYCIYLTIAGRIAIVELVNFSSLFFLLATKMMLNITIFHCVDSKKL
jgi:hypothetical protein